MIFKYPNGFPYEIHFVTGGLLSTLVNQAIPFDGLKKISAYHDKLSFGEVATFIAAQHAVGKLFGVEMPEPKAFFGEGHNGGMVEQAFNAIDSNAIAEVFRSAHSFHSTKIGQVMVIAADAGDSKVVGSWEKLKARNLSAAVVETIYARVGYLEAHFRSVPQPALGELSLTEVYKLLHAQNS